MPTQLIPTHRAAPSTSRTRHPRLSTSPSPRPLSSLPAHNTAPDHNGPWQPHLASPPSSAAVMEDAALCETGDAAPVSLGATTETDPEIGLSKQAQQQVSPAPSWSS